MLKVSTSLKNIHWNQDIKANPLYVYFYLILFFTLNFVAAPIQCPLGGSLYAGNGHCYVLKSGSYTWTQASTQCQALGANQARLAVIDSQTLENFIVSSVLG